nr:hypothetical protein [uncultured Campylobacter sp.]
MRFIRFGQADKFELCSVLKPYLYGAKFDATVLNLAFLLKFNHLLSQIYR